MQGSKELWKSALDEEVERYIVGVDLGSGPDHTEYIVKSECKQDQGKPRLDLVPLEIVEAIGIVMTKALETYTEGSWRRVERFRFKAAMMRHLVRYMANPKSVAKDTKLPHLWHLATNVAFLISMDWEGEE